MGTAAAGLAAVAIVLGHLLPANAATVAAGVGAVASGAAVASASPRWRPAGAAIGAVLLAAVCAGAVVSPAVARAAEAGTGHALLYGALAAWFGRSLLGGREAVVTRLARRLNPYFHPGMVPYTRAVTVGWCLFALAQLAASALLLAGRNWAAWSFLVGGGHAVLVAGMAAGEFAVRRWRFPGQHTGFWATVRGVRSNR